ncbi:hypothetical protein PF005_g32340 [Phytophthora fragariae]|uniref:Uncharacterized protein n=1 Tax=Phytophthora fragariae TaxID=53985 RepID=A0A6A3P971_9STRA|nr:hypothetical protein PF003_g25211 [Phytophthora fragariae]KAE8916794.1 hypothetical protein PF009_g32883 [Phytophthora fragariae]KAE8958217.1 hypothetical protein PF011_g30857 [Phytophthora fragariae]KAE9054117.1 hypothetical protein PF010_g32670 [Phytophthora fragariae]KAE9055647.1 hypothetical protein PF006_g32899 [Phytophthora fragariae]
MPRFPLYFSILGAFGFGTSGFTRSCCSSPALLTNTYSDPANDDTLFVSREDFS